MCYINHNLYGMFIYKITNKINGKIYIGQTIRSIKRRINQHTNINGKNNSILNKAVRKYGKENFQIEEICGANSLEELNYQEWLLIHKNNSLAPNGYNMVEGGKNKLATKESKKNMSLAQIKYFKNNKPNKCKKVINIETNEIYESAKKIIDLKLVPFCYSTLRSKLQGQNGNNTPFRYLGEENKHKEYLGSGNNQGKKVINIETNEIYESAKEVIRLGLIKSHVSTFNAKLNGSVGNNTLYRYLGEKCKSRKPKGRSLGNNHKARSVIEISTAKIWTSMKEACLDVGVSRSTMLKYCKNNNKFKYLEQNL